MQIISMFILRFVLELILDGVISLSKCILKTSAIVLLAIVALLRSTNYPD